MTPKYLYKILSFENWKESQNLPFIYLSNDDDDFIHLATEDQLERIIKKFWGSTPEFIVLKIETNNLVGKLVYEANPGGSNKYYHLYEGKIPRSSVIEVKSIKNNNNNAHQSLN